MQVATQLTNLYTCGIPLEMRPNEMEYVAKFVQRTTLYKYQALRFHTQTFGTIVENVPIQPAYKIQIENDTSNNSYTSCAPIHKRKRQEDVRLSRSCQHCNTDETPRWRPGPYGRNTLCNACGLQVIHLVFLLDY